MMGDVRNVIGTGSQLSGSAIAVGQAVGLIFYYLRLI
jgi:hypothetical protein